MTIPEMIAVLQAADRGETIQYRGRGIAYADALWMTAVTPVWDFEHWEFRVKPKPIEGWVRVYDDGEVGISFYHSEEHARRGMSAERLAHVREVSEE